MKLQSINSRLLSLLTVVFFSQLSFSKEHIRVSAFYVHPADMSQIVSNPIGWTPNCLQVRVKHSFSEPINTADYHFPKIGSGIAELAPELFIFPEMRVKDKNGWHKFSCNDFGNNGKNIESVSEITYSYCPGNDCAFGNGGLMGKHHVAPALYTQSDKGNWYIIPKKDNDRDTIDILFDVDTTLFYVRANKPLWIDKDGHANMELLPEDGFADFYLLYAIAYKHTLLDLQENHHLDFLFENINDSLCTIGEKEINVIYYEKDSVMNERVTYAKDVVNSMIKYIDSENVPRNLDIILSSQILQMASSNENGKAVFSLAKVDKSNSYGLLLVDHSMFYDKTLFHEILHTCFPHVYTHDSFNDNFFKESTIEYIASCIYSQQKKSDDVFVYHEKMIDEYMKSKKLLMQLLSSNHAVAISPNDTANTFWIYYDYFPMRLHTYAVANGGDKKLCDSLIDYLLCYKREEYTLHSLYSFMRKKGYKKFDKALL